MVLPLLPLAGAAALGGGAGFLGGFFSSKGKKEQTVAGGGSAVQDRGEVHAYQEHYAPVTSSSFAPNIGYAPQVSQSYVGSTYVISSPEAQVKKQIISEQVTDFRQDPVWDIPTAGGTRSDSATEGIDVTKIAIIAVIGAVAVAGVGAVTKGGKRR